MERKGNGDRSDPKMEGYLEKKRKSRLVSLWHRYWFILEGAELSYYDNRPTSAATASKGVIKLTAMTSVTAYSPTHRHPEPQANCEIYILTPSKLFTLRTKDVNEHKMWMCALLGQIAALTMGQSRGPALKTRTTLAVPFQSSHINYRHSLTSLTTMEENDNKHLSKCSRTMEYKEFKSGSTGNMLDRQVVTANRETDTETSSEEDVVVNKGGIETTNEGLRYKCHTEEMSCSTKMSNEGVIIDERMEKFSERSNVTIVTDQRSQQQVAKTEENKMEENEKSKEVQSVQIQESKVKSRKFFGRRETKTNSVQMSCAKVYKKSRETVVTDRIDADPKLLQAIKGDKRSKLEESHSKDETMLKKRITDSRSSNSSTDHKVSRSQVRRENSLPEGSEGMKLPNKPKIKRVKSKKESKGCQQSTEAQSHRKSKIAKTGDLPDEGETKAKVKKMGFFSKLVKCKKNENSDEKTEEMERDPSPEMSKELTEDEQQLAEEVSPEKKILHLPRYRTPMGLLIPKDDAEFQKKLLSRKMKIEADQESPVEATEIVIIKRASSMPLQEKDEDDDKVMTVDNEEAKPSLPPRAQAPAPPIPERKINPTQLDSKRNLPPENFPSINSKPRYSPKFTERYQNTGGEMKSNYDIVKFKVKKKESMEKPALTCSKGMNPRVEYSFTSESSTTINTSEVHIESHNMGRTGRREEMEIKVSEREKTEINFEEKFGMVMPTIILQEIPSDTSSIRSLNTIEIEEEAMLDADINLGKRGTMDIQTMTFFETSSLNKHSLSEHRISPTCSTPIPTVTFDEIPSYPSIYTTTELSDTSSTSFLKTYFSASSASEERASNKVDELGLLLSELDRINSAPLENIDSKEKPVLTPKEEKRLSSDKEDFLEAFPIRKRRGSDPDYDIPRPHRLPKHLPVSQDPDKNDFSGDDNERKDNDTNNSITIEATCFLGPGMDQSYNENRYYGFSTNDWSRKSDEMKQYLESKYGGSDVSEEKDSFLQNLDLEDFEGKEMKENISASKCSEKYFEEKGGSAPESKRDSEISVNLRPEKINRSCRNERSREVYQSDLQDLLKLTETMDYLSLTRTPDEGEATDSSNQENDSLLPMEIPNVALGPGEFNLEESGSRMETAGVQLEGLDSIANANKMAVKSSTVADDERLLQEIPVDKEAEESEVKLRNPLRCDFSDLRDNKTLRLSFATTETLIVEEEVLVASLKTTTTTTFSSPIEDQTNNGEREEVEESVEEVVLDMDSISDDHFGSMKIQSCVQT